MSNLEAPLGSGSATFPAPSPGAAADRAALPPPDLRVPAVAPPQLAPLNGGPIVPPMPTLTLDESDELLATTTPALAVAVLDVPTDNSDCPVIVESTPTLAVPGIGEAFVETNALSPANEPLGSPPQVAMVAPALPTVGQPAPAAAPAPADAPAIPPAHQPSQAGRPTVAPLTGLDLDADSTVDVQRTGRTTAELGKIVARTFGAILLAGALGAGAHLGYDWWETRNDPAVGGVAVDGTDLFSWPQVDTPAIRYTDTVTSFRSESGVRTLTAHRELSSGVTKAVVATNDAAGVDAPTIDVDFRGAESYRRLAPEAQWEATGPDDALALIGDTWSTDVFTARDVFPAEMAPFVTILESVERSLPVAPLRPAVEAAEAADVPIAVSTEPTSMVWQYRVIIDTEAFRAGEALAFQSWQRQMGRMAVARIEVWIDNTGIVRQISTEADGTAVTHTLVEGSATSNEFASNPLLDAAEATAAAADTAAPPAVPAGETQPAPDEAEDGE